MEMTEMLCAGLDVGGETNGFAREPRNLLDHLISRSSKAPRKAEKRAAFQARHCDHRVAGTASKQFINSNMCTDRFRCTRVLACAGIARCGRGDSHFGNNESPNERGDSCEGESPLFSDGAQW
jgi:hypothetical protein